MSSGVEAKKLLNKAVKAYEAVLQVFTKEDLPQFWAETKNNLGEALVSQAKLSSAQELNAF